MLAELRHAAQRTYRESRVLVVTGLIMFVQAAFLLLVSQFDDRLVMGVNVWIKPMKFAASFGLFFLTLAWLLTYLSTAVWVKRFISWGNVLLLIPEALPSAIQAARGTTSHFNWSTPLDGALFLAMGVGVLLQTGLVVWTLALFFTPNIKLPPAQRWAFRLGIVVFLLGLLPGVMMIIQSSHAVGVADGGAGIPLLNWSAEGGDLRVSHFIGLHGIQLIPLAGWLIGRRRKMSEAAKTAAVCSVSAAYAGVMLAAFVQALAGMPLLAAL